MVGTLQGKFSDFRGSRDFEARGSLSFWPTGIFLKFSGHFWLKIGHFWPD